VIVFDASVLIAYLDGEDVHHHDAVELLASEAATEFVAATLTLGETLVGPARSGVLDAAIGALHEIGVTESYSVEGDAERLARVRSETNLKIPDCVVLVAAENAQARVATFYHRLANEARQRGLEVVPDLR
jgi:predicted nucleic acid-binding protein